MRKGESIRVVLKVLKYRDRRSWQPKVTAIKELKDIVNMSLAALFGKLMEHEMEINQLIKMENSEKKNNRLALKARENGDESMDEE